METLSLHHLIMTNTHPPLNQGMGCILRKP